MKNCFEIADFISWTVLSLKICYKLSHAYLMVADHKNQTPRHCVLQQRAQRELICQANHLSNFGECQFNYERWVASLRRRSRIVMKFWSPEIWLRQNTTAVAQSTRNFITFHSKGCISPALEWKMSNDEWVSINTNKLWRDACALTIHWFEPDTRFTEERSAACRSRK